MLESLSMRLFGKFLAPHLEQFESLKESMWKGRMPWTLHEYLSITAFVSAVVFLISLVLSIIVALTVKGGVLFGVILPIVVTASSFMLCYYYPSLKAKDLRNRIDRSLPFAVFYMTTTASSGAHPATIFQMLSLRGGVIGEEASRIYSNVKSLGMDITTALQRAAARSPSPRFAELLWGMVSILTSGGDMESYLRGRSRTVMSQYRRALNNYAKTVAFYTEIYITLVIVGSIFFIILLAIISPMVGGNTLFIQTFLVFFFVPLVSVGFIMLLKGASPME